MKREFLAASILLCSTWSSAQSCINEGTILGKAAKDCMTNVSMPKETFENLCSVWQKNPDPSLPVKTTFVERCPKDYVGYCEVTAPAGAVKHYYYRKETAARAKKGCTSANPLSPPGVWHDQ
jgi:hypothetical protein